MNSAAFDSETLQSRRARVARELALTDEILLIGAGEPVPLPENTDQQYPFRAHSEYFYLASIECPGGVVALTSPAYFAARRSDCTNLTERSTAA